MAEESIPSLVGQEISGCEILQKVAMGGMGSVYKARHKALDRIVCVKILSPALTNDKKAVELFLTEARAIAELEHPNIVQVYNVGKEKGYYFIVMGFIEGQTLSQLIKHNKNLPLDTVLDLFEGILLGLDAAHAKGIIHRDIKPSNILINADMQPKIVDFGIAKKMDKDKGSTKTTELAGTAYFIAPEQALGRDLDTRADLYSVGASLYYVLTGQFPYNGKNTIDIIQKHINEPVPNPAALVPELPAWLTGAVQKLMAKKPEDRFQTAKETYVYFQKMRAEEQLRLEQGGSLNLSSNNSLKLVKEEKFSTTSVQQTRQAEKYIKQSANTKPSLLPSVDAAVVVENKPQVKPQPTQPALANTPQNVKQAPVVPNTQQAPQTTARTNRKLLLNLAVKLPLFCAFIAWVTYVFYHLGTICSVHIDGQAGFLSGLWRPFIAGRYEPGQLLFALLAVITLAAILFSAYIKEYARATLTLLVLSAVAYMAGLFTPQISLTDFSMLAHFLFTPAYYGGYLVVAATWLAVLCFTFNRTVSQGILGGALAAFVVTLCYLATRLSIAPDASDTLMKILFFVSLFSTVISVYYLASRQEKTSIFKPVFCLLVAMWCMWVYTASGLVHVTRTSAQTLIDTLQIQPLNGVAQNALAEEELGIDSNRERFAYIDQNNAVSQLNKAAAQDFLEKHIQEHAAGFFSEQQTTFFAGLLDEYYRGGEGKMNTAIWKYALLLPVERLNEQAPQTAVYGFMMWALMALAGAFCIGSIVFTNKDTAL